MPRPGSRTRRKSKPSPWLDIHPASWSISPQLFHGPESTALARTALSNPSRDYSSKPYFSLCFLVFLSPSSQFKTHWTRAYTVRQRINLAPLFKLPCDLLRYIKRCIYRFTYYFIYEQFILGLLLFTLSILKYATYVCRKLTCCI